MTTPKDREMDHTRRFAWFSKLSDGKQALGALATVFVAGAVAMATVLGFVTLPERVAMLERNAATHAETHGDLPERVARIEDRSKRNASDGADIRALVERQAESVGRIECMIIRIAQDQRVEPCLSTRPRTSE
jgi:hypothetical protein